MNYDTASPDEQKLMKLELFDKLCELVSDGIHLSQNYNVE